MKQEKGTPELMATVELRVTAPPAGHVVVCNGLSEPVRIFNMGNSWGDEAWSFELLTDGDKPRAVRRRPQIYTRNVPSTTELAPGLTEKWPFDLGDGTWELEAAEAPSGAALTAIYDAPPTPEAEELGVFTGPLRSEPVDLA